MKILILTMTLVLTGCIETAPKKNEHIKHYSNEVFEQLYKEVLDCGAKNVSEVDDEISDATTIALVLAKRCTVEYEKSIQYFAYGNAENERQTRLLLNMAREQKNKVERFLPIVLKYRSLKRQNNQKIEQQNENKNEQKNEKI